MKNYIKNSAFEYIYNENDTITIFNEDMTEIHSLDKVGKTILELFSEAINTESMQLKLSDIFFNINYDELNNFVSVLKEKKIIVEA